jgi:uncharacterized protein
MSESVIPSYVDTRKVFQSDGKLTGSISLDRLPRFREILANDNAEVKVELEFSLNRSKQRLIAGQVQAKAEVACQRCLEPVQVEFSDKISLALVRHESDIAKLDGTLDPWLVEDHKLSLAELVEEQLLLGMPIVSTHEDVNCLRSLEYEKQHLGVSGDEEPAQGNNPFAVLKTLKD